MSSEQYTAYIIRCSVNNKVYVGITSRPLRERWRGHKAVAQKRNTKLCRAMRKHGVEKFSIHPVACAKSWDDLLALEVQLIAQHDSKDNGYNSTDGGEGVMGFKWPQESIDRISVIRREAWGDLVYRARMSAATSAAWVNRPDEYKQAHSERAAENIKKAHAALARRPRKPPKPRLGKGWNMKSKTHCPQGHPYDEDNTIHSRGGRTCKTCKLAEQQRRRAKKSEAATTAPLLDLIKAAEVAAERKFCANGHELTGENLYVRPDGECECRECRREASKRSKRKRRESKIAA